mgnify:FL=1
MNSSIYIIVIVVAIWGFAMGYIIRGDKDE